MRSKFFIDGKIIFALMLTIIFLTYFINNTYSNRIIEFPRPEKIIIVSGNNQSGTAGMILPELLVIQVLNQLNTPVPLINVTFSVIDSDGTISHGPITNQKSITLITDYFGKASVAFKLGTKKGEHKVMVTVEDLNPVIFTATVGNSKPVIDPISDKQVNEGETLTFTVIARDADPEDIITLSASALPNNATFNTSTGVFTFTPNYNQAGVYSITFTASDGALSSSIKVKITVIDVNRPPVLDPIGNKTVNENSELIIVLSATDPDGDLITYSASGIPTGATFNPELRTFKWKPGYDTVKTGDKLDFSVTFIAKDDKGAEDSEKITITVFNVLPPPEPNIRVIPLKIDFGTVLVGESSDRIFQIHNEGTSKLKILNIKTTNPQFHILRYLKTESRPILAIDINILQTYDDNQIKSYLNISSDFTPAKYSASDPLMSVNYPDLNPGECLLVRVQFTPSSVGIKTGRFIVESDDPDEPIININVQGLGVQMPDIVVLPNSLDFGNVEVGKSSSRILYIRNEGNVLLDIQNIEANDPQFTVSNFTDVNPFSEINVTVTFNPTSAGDKTTTLVITSNDPDEPNVFVSLQGKGFIVPKPNIRVVPTSLEFGDVLIGKSLTKEINIFNDGNAVLQISSITSNNGQFTISNIGDVPPNQYITISIRFTPLTAGLKTGTITIVSNDPDEPIKLVPVQGNGVDVPKPNIRVSTTSIDFGNVELGKSSTKEFKIFNDGDALLSISSIISSNSQFSVLNWSDVLPGKAVTISVSFTPITLGLKIGIITINSNDPDEPTKTVSVQGSGIKVPIPDISVDPTYLDFGRVEVGKSSTKDFKIYNTGDGELQITNISSNHSNFTVINDSTKVLPGSFITVLVRFMPQSVGLKSGTITINSNDPDEPTKRVSVIGNGIPVPVPDIRVEPTSLDFGSVEIGTYLIKELRIYNDGELPLQISSIQSNNTQFETSTGTQVSPGGVLSITVKFSPTSVSSKTAEIKIRSNDPDEPVVTVNLYGKGIYPELPGIGKWVYSKPLDSSDLTDLHFINENKGWIVGQYGTIARSDDGGNTWTRQYSGTSRSLNGVFFIDANNGWIVGQYGTIIKTTNGGTNWLFQSTSISNSLRDIYFISPTRGWAVGENGTIIFTNDGFTWTRQTSGTQLDLNSVYFINAYQGWVVGNYGVILYTIDGGNTWVAQNNGTTSALYGIDFINIYEGWIVGSNGTILRTQDGGRNWYAQSAGIVYDRFTDVDFYNSFDGWITGANGIILRTVNGGSTWVRVDSDTSYSLNSLQFINPDVGWAVGANGTFLSYNPDYPSVINSVTVTGSPAKAGDIIGVTAIGQANNYAVFSISGVVSNVVMTETSPGNYSGSYTVQSGLNVTDAVVTVVFRNKYGNVATNSSQKVTIDSIAVINSVNVSPAKVRVGDTIKVTMIGEPLGSAKFTIETLVTDVSMTESSTTPGTYTGQYIIPIGTKSANVNVSVRFTDKLGNTTTRDAGQITIETIANIVSVSISGSPAKFGTPIIIIMIGDANGTAKYSIAGLITDEPMIENQPGIYTASYTASKGTFIENGKVNVKLTDKYGNTATKEAGTVTIDTECRIDSVTISGSPGKVGDVIRVTLKGESKGQAKFTIPGVISDQIMHEQPSGSGTYIGSYTIVAGVNATDVQLTVTLTDAVGNVNTDTSQRVTIDTKAPEIISVNVTGSPGKAGGIIKVTMISEPNGKAKFSIDGVTIDQYMVEGPNGTYIGSYTIADGVNVTNASLVITLTDLIGNSSIDTSQKVTIDTKAPEITSVNVTGSPGKAGETIKVTMIGEPGGKAKFSIANVISDQPMTEMTSGNYSGSYVITEGINVTNAILTIVLSDSVGNLSMDTSQRVTIDTVAPVINSVNIVGTPGKAGETIKITMLGEPNGKAKFTIEGVISEQSMFESPLGTYTGNYIIPSGLNVVNAMVTVTLTDASGNISTNTSQQVTIDNKAPDILSIDIEGSPAKIGENIKITIKSEPGAKAQFSIADVIENVNMEESKDNHGTYIGVYSVDKDKNISSAVLTIIVKDKVGNVSSDSSKKVSIVLLADLNRDGIIDISDFIVIAKYYGQTVTEKIDADINNDGIVNILDLLLLSKQFVQLNTLASPRISSAKISAEDLTVLKKLYESIQGSDNNSDINILRNLLAVFTGQDIKIAKSELLQNYPNPFNPDTWIPFKLSTPGEVSIKIYSLSGQLVRRIDLGYKSMGDYTSKDKAVYWDGTNNSGEKVSSGIYFYEIRSNNFTAVKKMIMSK
ncbi:MAG: choice-of-anchor D domain-containing protein [bacterium]